MKFKIFLINLDERKDKLENVKTQLDNLNISLERISAVRGNQLSDKEISQAYSPTLNTSNYLKSMSVGEIGCYLSHRAAWTAIVEQELDFAVLIEDDAKILDGFEHIFNILDKLTNWDYVKLHGGRGNRKIQDSLPINKQHNLVHYNKAPVSTLAQGISLRGAKKLLKYSQPFYRPVDVDIQLFWEKDIDVLGLEPRIVDKANFDSDIENMSKGKGRAKKSGFWQRLKYRGKLAIARQHHNKKRPDLSTYIE